MARIPGWHEISKHSKRYRKWVLKVDGKTFGRATISRLRSEWFVVVKTADRYTAKTFNTFIEAVSWVRKEMKRISMEVVRR